MDFSVAAQHIPAAHTVLGDIDGGLIALVEEFQAPTEALRSHRPVVAGIGEAGCPVHISGIAVLVRLQHDAVVNVFAHKVQRLGYQGHIRVRDLGKIRRVLFQTVLRVFPQEYRIGEPGYVPGPVVQTLGTGEEVTAAGLDILGGLPPGIDHAAGGCIAHLDGPDSVLSQGDHRRAVGLQHIMDHLKQILLLQLDTRGVTAMEMGNACEALGFIQGDKITYPVGESPADNPGVFREPVYALFIHPTALLLQGLGIIPMVEGNIGLNAVAQQLIDHRIIEGDALFIDSSDALRQNPGPAEGESVGLDAHLPHDGDVFLIAMVEVTGHIAVMTLVDLAGGMGEYVPDALSPAAFIGSALNLIGAGSAAPDKAFVKHGDSSK